MEYIYICIDIYIYIYWKTVGIDILFMFGPIRIAIEIGTTLSYLN